MIDTQKRNKLLKELLINHTKEVKEINKLTKEFNDYLIELSTTQLTKEEKEFCTKFPDLYIRQKDYCYEPVVEDFYKCINKRRNYMFYSKKENILNTSIKFSDDLPRFYSYESEIKLSKEWKEKLEKHYNLLNAYMEKYDKIKEILSDPELTIKTLKRESPKIYAVYEKIK